MHIALLLGESLISGKDFWPKLDMRSSSMQGNVAMMISIISHCGLMYLHTAVFGWHADGAFSLEGSRRRFSTMSTRSKEAVIVFCHAGACCSVCSFRLECRFLWWFSG